MKRYETRPTPMRRLAGTVCDGCGLEQGFGPSFAEVIISVHEGEEGGGRDEYDYCDDCLVQRAPALVAAGSRAPLVTGDPL